MPADSLQADPSHAWPADDTSELTAMIDAARIIAVFTGAGISTESGVPDYRSPNSPWTRNKPIPYQEFLANDALRREAWRRKFAMDDLYRGIAQPNRGHRFVAGLVQSGRSPGVITQNIDGLHQASGVPEERVIELHGNGSYAVCLLCGARHSLAQVRTQLETSDGAPACEACGGIVKSATVSFGQAMPREAVERARDLTLACDLFLVMGSSLVVQPAASFPVLARRNGARLVIINREPTVLDAEADLVVRGAIGRIVGALGVS